MLPKEIDIVSLDILERCDRTPDERCDILKNLYKKGSDIDEYMQEFLEIYAKTDLNSLTKTGQKWFNKFLYQTWNKIEYTGDYLIFNGSGKGTKSQILSKRTLRNRKAREVVFNDSDNVDDENPVFQSPEEKKYKKGMPSDNNYYEDLEFKSLLESKMLDGDEMSVAMLIGQGFTQEQIAQTMEITRSQVRTLIEKIKESYGAEFIRGEFGWKVCKKCRIEKHFEEFSQDDRKLDGKQTICKACDRERKRITKERRLQEKQPKK